MVSPLPTYETSLIFAAISEIEPRLRPVHTGTVLIGLDSLRAARLTAAIRVQMGRVLSAAQLRSAKSVAELLTIVSDAEKINSGASAAHVPSDLDREYSIWFTPGQRSGMGQWVLRSDQRIDIPAVQHAVQKLTERHSALRAECLDSLRYMSFVRCISPGMFCGINLLY